ncbi:5-formyltetrahydrofolate cyclo-ligase [Methylococcus geothermalis]|uniref:5-formyltetrahydrofolate cyclo-ligase n=1 Tax=Methylococcus geothermalis TaxID=2681310 RepID=A0A858Q429_9GAMM|nr:5-formyltetrahydrofolate cyclo-ligase [Methylococcus geothermalis]QJD28589.1 5-formyltetrahydrofolate cyclo-ligase [Methylococcus geothermalis]
MTAPTGIRTRIREWRRSQSPSEARRKSLQIAKQCIGSGWFDAKVRIAAYLAHDGEVETTALFEYLRELGRTGFVPILRKEPRRMLWFGPYAGTASMRPNRYGIPEPPVDQGTITDARELDLVFMPLVAFDPRGNRLGMGGGYYDRTFAFRLDEPASAKPRLIGLAFEGQKVERLEAQPWDVPLDAVVTEAGIYRFPAPSA